MATNGSISPREIIDVPERREDGEKIETASELVEEKTGANTADTPAVVDVSAQARDLTGRVLDFLSNASNETLGACLAGLVASTWLILGRIGLVLIGVGGGIVLHATWEDRNHDHANEDAKALDARKRREKSLDIAGRLLDWRGRTTELDGSKDGESTSKELDSSGFSAEIGRAMTDLTNAIIRDYVKYVRANSASSRILTYIDGGTDRWFQVMMISHEPVGTL